MKTLPKYKFSSIAGSKMTRTFFVRKKKEYIQMQKKRRKKKNVVAEKQIANSTYLALFSPSPPKSSPWCVFVTIALIYVWWTFFCTTSLVPPKFCISNMCCSAITMTPQKVLSEKISTNNDGTVKSCCLWWKWKLLLYPFVLVQRLHNIFKQYLLKFCSPFSKVFPSPICCRIFFAPLLYIANSPLSFVRILFYPIALFPLISTAE